MIVMSYFSGVDPAAALIRDGELVAYVEEERLIRFKHATNIFPVRSIEACLEKAGATLSEVDSFVYGWDAMRYADGRMEAFYEDQNKRYPPDDATRAWQRRLLGVFRPEQLKKRLYSELVAHFGISLNDVPPLTFYPHHKAHAAAAFLMSPFEEAAVLTIDGSGDSECTVVWHGKGIELEPIHRIEIPHSLGWFYSAITELLGFKAYDGEYKVMGLAAYGSENMELRAKLNDVLKPGPSEFDYELDPSFIHHGAHTYSTRYTDKLPEHLGVEPRLGTAPLTKLHEDLAFEAQRALEETVLRLLSHVRAESGLKNLCIGGGVGLNVKMNSRILKSGLFDEVFPHPIPNDSGLSIGAAIGEWTRVTGTRPEPLKHVYLGPSYSDEAIEDQVRSCGLSYRKCDDIATETAKLLADGKIVAWFQGAMEGGPRALGGRSILGDPRDVSTRDRVNSAIKFREYWRPFCPSMSDKAASQLLDKCTTAPYMVLAHDATDEAHKLVPAIVHVDGTARTQTVNADTNPRYHALLMAFEKLAGVPVLLNTSFNIKGEAIVCSPRDAIRTFSSTGIDALAIGSLLLEKPEIPLALEPEDVIR